MTNTRYSKPKALGTVPDSWIAERVKELKAKRDLSYKLIMDIPSKYILLYFFIIFIYSHKILKQFPLFLSLIFHRCELS